MSVDYLALAVEGVKSLKPYKPGKPIDELARELGLDPATIVKLASNESPLGPSSAVSGAIESAISELSRYPDGAGFDLKAELSERLKVQPEQLTLGNGSSDILAFIVGTFVNDGDSVVVSEHAFSIYGLLTKAVGGRTIEVPARGFGHDLQAMAAAIESDTKIVFVTNPNNPTGTWNPADELIEFLDAVPEQVLVLLDEAYFEYVKVDDYLSGIGLLNRYPNLVVARTFSKAFGLAALRVGFGVSSPELAGIMNRIRLPFNVNSFAQAAALAALKDEAHLQEAVATNDRGMALITSELESLGLEYIPSAGNFLSFKVPTGVSAHELYEQMLALGVIIRPIASYGMPDYLRVSIGTDAENRTFLTALKKVLS
jgi:histidinol-phosphate aminotransferase